MLRDLSIKGCLVRDIERDGSGERDTGGESLCALQGTASYKTAVSKEIASQAQSSLWRTNGDLDPLFREIV